MLTEEMVDHYWPNCFVTSDGEWIRVYANTKGLGCPVFDREVVALLGDGAAPFDEFLQEEDGVVRIGACEVRAWRSEDRPCSCCPPDTLIGFEFRQLP